MSYSNPLAAYLAGKATPEQSSVVDKWVSRHPDNEALLQSLSQSWEKDSLKMGNLPDLEIKTEAEEGLLED